MMQFNNNGLKIYQNPGKRIMAYNYVCRIEEDFMKIFRLSYVNTTKVPREEILIRSKARTKVQLSKAYWIKFNEIELFRATGELSKRLQAVFRLCHSVISTFLHT